ncbi:MAG: response regulator [Magnetococcales bacterium]|nr:response regulator [Magnetococcales bacterium]NGZ26728.1 response regulator [Magnetococcales bacterium]
MTAHLKDIPQDRPFSGRILLVDDEREFLRVTCRLLEKFGYHVTAFENGLDALIYFQQYPLHFDAVVTDQSMPQIEGVDLFIRLRSCNSTIPVVVCSGNCRIIPLATVCNLGLDAILQKPVDILTLDQLLQQLIRGREGTPALHGDYLSPKPPPPGV